MDQKEKNRRDGGCSDGATRQDENRKTFSTLVVVAADVGPLDVLQGVRGRASDRCELCRRGLCKRGGSWEQRTGKGENTGEERRRRCGWRRWRWNRGGFSCLSLPRSWLPPPLPPWLRFLLPIASRALAEMLKFGNVARSLFKINSLAQGKLSSTMCDYKGRLAF